MPIYEYQCTGCHHEYDLIQKMSEAPVTQCPKCFENSATRLVSAPAFQLKGTGWYATDFKDKGKPEKSSAKVDSAAKTASEAKTTDKSVSSSASKGETD